VKIILLKNWAYRVNMGPWNDDRWGLTGEAYGHPRFPDGEIVTTSTPKAFDRESMVVITLSGSIYMLGDCGGNLEEQIQHIVKDVKRVEAAQAG
jgi:hypothetical protein